MKTSIDSEDKKKKKNYSILDLTWKGPCNIKAETQTKGENELKGGYTNVGEMARTHY